MYRYSEIWSQVNCKKHGYALPKENQDFVTGELIVVVDIISWSSAE